MTGVLHRAELRVRDHGPLGRADGYATAYATPLVVAAPGVLVNDDPQGGAFLQATFASFPAHGTLVLNFNGGFVYTPAAGFAGTDTFLYRPWTAEGYGAWTTVSVAVGQPPDPQPPSQLRVDSVAGTAVTLRWRPPAIGPAPTGYLLEGGLAPGQTLQTLATGPVPVLTFPAPAGSFVIRVRSVVGTAVSAPSSEVPLHVNVPVPPSPPAGLTAVVQGSTLSLAWRNTFAGGPPSDLLLQVSGALTGTVPLAVTEGISFSNVPAGTYEVTLNAVNAGGISGKSNTVAFTVPDACSGTPHAPTGALVYRIGSTVHVVWDAAATGAAATSYQLAVSGSFVGAVAVPARAFSAPAPPGTYSISVAAMNACGVSAPTAPLTIVVP